MADLQEALGRIDAALADWSSLSIVAQSDVVDLLLDLRNHLTVPEPLTLAGSPA